MAGEGLEAVSPVAGAPLGVGYGNNLNFIKKLTINDGKGIPLENNALRTVEVWGIQSGPVMDAVESRKQLLIKAFCSL